jgi:anti-sigma factor RsiW
MWGAVSDVASQPGPDELADLCALADGSLPDERRAEVEARVAASSELQELLERQRQAVLATGALASDEPSPSLRAAVQPLAARPRGGRRVVPRVAFAGVLASAAAVVAAVLLSGGPGAPTVADAARLATEPAAQPAPAAAGTAGTRLAIGLEGVAFPDFASAYGWQAVGVRRGRIDGRDAIVVYYRKDGRRLAYAIVAGSGLAVPSGGQTEVRRAVPYKAVRLNDRLVVTWRRGGHTCVLVGDAPRSELVRLASWPLSPSR